MQRRQTAWVHGFSAYTILLVATTFLSSQTLGQTPGQTSSTKPRSQPQSAVSIPKCSLETFTRDCSAFQRAGVNLNGNTELGVPKKQDHTICFNPIAAWEQTDSPEFSRLTRRNPGAERQAFELAERVRTETISYLTNRAPKENWTAEQKAMVTRLETLKIKIMDFDHPFCSEAVPMGVPNLMANFSTHSVEFCPSVAVLPPGQIIRGFAHEFGHVVSPCRMTDKHYTVNPVALADEEAVFECLGISDLQLREFDRLFETGHMVLPEGNELARSLESCFNAIEETPGTQVKEAKLFGSHLRCLKSRWETPWKNFLDQEMQFMLEHNPDMPRTLKGADIAGENPLHCHQPLDENFADAVAAKVFGRMIESGRIKREDVRASTIDAAGYTCQEQMSGQAVFNPFAYPDANHRLQTLLSDPFVQDSLGCRDLDGPAVCSLSDPGAGGASSATSPSGAPSRSLRPQTRPAGAVQ